MKILLIEDDEILVDILVQSLTSQRYVVDTALDGEIGWEYAQGTNYDLILIDVGLPKLNGIALCQRLRSEGCSTPILLITAVDASTERIRGLDAGADDYLIKPLDLGELQARVRALLRRKDAAVIPLLEVGALLLDPNSCQVTYEGKLLGLTPKEYSLLELFLRNPLRVFSRANIIEHLWTLDDPPQEDSVKAHIKGLRQKLKAAGAVDWIENVYGLGYRLKPQQQESKGVEENLTSKSPNPQSEIPTPPTVEHQFNQARDKLWQQYQGLMAQRLEVLQQAAIALQNGSLSPELRQSAASAAHKLAGVLGMFEREAGTLIAREIERILLGDADLIPTHQRQLLALISDLDNSLSLTVANKQAKAEHRAKGDRLLLIDSDLQLGSALQQLAQSENMGWEQVTTLTEAKTWLRVKSPDLVVLSVDQVEQQAESLALLADLAKRTPPVPTLVLAADQSVDRVTVARTGGRGFLVKPVTATQVWDAASQLLQHTRSLAVSVLVVDDDPVFLAALRLMLEPWGIRMTGLDHPQRFWEVLEATKPDLLILDVQMPQISGIELCQAVRIDPKWQGLPVLFLTAQRDLNTIQQVFAAGADDYVVKPVVGPELLTRIINRLERIHLFQTFSTKDPIAGVANQPQSSRDLENLLRQTREPVCLVVFSVTELRQINIQYGHNTGNQVLQRWGRLFQAAFRGAEVLGYWGNGEFVVGMPGLTKKEASDRISDVLTTLRQQVFTAPDNSRFQAFCSFATAEYPTDGLTLQSVYQSASSAIS